MYITLPLLSGNYDGLELYPIDNSWYNTLAERFGTKTIEVICGLTVNECMWWNKVQREMESLDSSELCSLQLSFKLLISSCWIVLEQ